MGPSSDPSSHSDESGRLPPEAAERLQALLAERDLAAEAKNAKLDRMLSYLKASSTLLAGVYAILLFFLLPPDLVELGGWLSLPVTLATAMIWDPRRAKERALEANQPADRTPEWLIVVAAWVVLVIVVGSLGVVTVASMLDG